MGRFVSLLHIVVGLECPTVSVDGVINGPRGIQGGRGADLEGPCFDNIHRRGVAEAALMTKPREAV